MNAASAEKPPLERALAPTWIFGVTGIAYGVAGGFQGTLMPYLLRRAGITVEEIGLFVFATFLPPILQFVWAPIVDWRLRRRTWLVIVAALGSMCFYTALGLK